MDQTEEFGTFADLELNSNILKTVRKMGFEKPSAIQQKVIPLILEGKDVIAQAETGSGKTAAFGLPSLHKLHNREGISLLVITPTRELANQVSDELNRYGALSNFESMAVFGGQSISIQIRKLRQGVQAIVATPGRLLDLLKSKRLKNLAPAIVVLDEADEMLDMGFLEDIQAIFEHLESDHQTLLFSATMPKPIQKLANEVLNDPVSINVAKGQTSHKDIEEKYYLAKEQDKDLALVRLFDAHQPFKSIIFCKTKRDVDRLYNTLMSLGYAVRCLHGDMAQNDRQKAIASFTSGDSKILVATDVAGRGLNVPDISHVFNYHIPFSAEGYTHRIGRTGRAGRKGTAITILSPSEFRQMTRMRNLTKDKMDINPLPSLSELQELQQLGLIAKIAAQEEQKGAEKILNQLQGDMNLYQIGVNLLSMLMKEQKFTGPENLGMRVDEIYEESRSGRKPAGRRSGGGGGGGGGAGGGGKKFFGGRPSFKGKSNASSGARGNGGGGGAGAPWKKKSPSNKSNARPAPAR